MFGRRVYPLHQGLLLGPKAGRLRRERCSSALPFNHKTHTMRAVMSVLGRSALGSILAFACLQASAQRGPGHGAKAFPFARSGGWEVRLVAADAKGKAFVHCRADRLWGSETFLMLFDDGREQPVGFSSDASLALGEAFSLRWWTDAPDPVITTAASLDGEPATRMQVMRFKVNNDEPGELGMLMAGRKLTVQGPDKQSWVYDMTDSGNAFKRLMDCAERFAPTTQRN